MPGTPGGMENAHETLAAECTGVEARFPHRLGRRKRRPRGPHARSLYSSNTTSRVGLVHPLRNRWEEIDRPTSLRSDERSRSPESVFTIPESGVQLHRYAQHGTMIPGARSDTGSRWIFERIMTVQQDTRLVRVVIEVPDLDHRPLVVSVHYRRLKKKRPATN